MGRTTAVLIGLGLTACGRADGSRPPGRGDTPAQPAVSAQGVVAPDKSEEPEAETSPREVAEPAPMPTPAQAGSCPKKGSGDIGILITPRRPSADRPLRIVAATLADETPLAVRVETDDGDAIEAELTYRPGVPSATLASIEAPPAGRLRVIVGREGTGLRCAKAKVSAKAGRAQPRGTSDDGVWPIDREWNAGEEALYSAWVRELFWAPRGDDLAWEALHQVTSDPTRNLLHDYYGWGEDAADTREGLFLRPDCADTPYFLRAYFAWKRGLPFGFRHCSRGGNGKAPRCGPLEGVLGKPKHPPDTRKPGELGAVQRYLRRTLAWGVHTGNGRTAFGDDGTDFYPVSLSRRTLRPGIIYADPYGHIFVVVGFMAPDEENPGVLYAIDGQPDGSITRKRFWEGNFLFNPDPALGGSGFKAFRPVAVERVDGSKQLVALPDRTIAEHEAYGDIGDEQAKLDAHAFYDKMDALITPGRRDPKVALREAVTALHEAAKVRVTSVENGDEHVSNGAGTITMPDGYEIFETTGAWESFSTPARDLRLLIAIDVVTGFEDKVARNADVFLRPGQKMKAVRERLAEHRKKLLADGDLSFAYTRSDGSSWTLTLAELIERAKALEMGYNPNDCPEIRWAAPTGSDERKTCKRRAPAEQLRKMKAYRPWFTERRRPPRGDPGPPVQ